MKKKGAGIIFIVIGTMIMVVGILTGVFFLKVSGKFNRALEKADIGYKLLMQKYNRTDGYISKIQDNDTYVVFDDKDGVEHEFNLEISSPTCKEGKKVKVYYNKDDPDNAMAPELEIEIITSYTDLVGYWSGFGVLTMFFQGATFIIIGIIFVKRKKVNQKSKHIL